MFKNRCSQVNIFEVQKYNNFMLFLLIEKS
jgi:hypothetical protein